MGRHLFYDLFDRVQGLDCALKSDGLFEAAREMYGIDHVVYSRINSPIQTNKGCFVQGTYPREWLQHYFDNDFLSVDPVSLYGRRAHVPFDWYDLPKDNPEARRVFDESIEFGFGKQGLCLPVVGLNGERAQLNINSSDSVRDWKARKPKLIRDFQIITLFYHHRVVTEMENVAPSHAPVLSEKEYECLKWAASGKSVWATSVILAESERNIRFHLDRARQKLGCTTKIQAVAKAVASGIINIS